MGEAPAVAAKGTREEDMAENGKHRLEVYLGRLLGYALSLTNEREIARDLVQECTVKVLSARQVPEQDAAYRAWLFRILHNAMIDRLRRERSSFPALDDETELPNQASLRIEESLINGLTVRKGLRELSLAHREIIALIDIAGFSYAEAADHLQVPVGTVMSRLSRARAALLAAISEENVHSLPRHIQGRRA